MNRAQRRQAERNRLKAATQGGKMLSAPPPEEPDQEVTLSLAELLQIIETGDRFAICGDGHVVIRTDKQVPVEGGMAFEYAHLPEESHKVMVERVHTLARIARMWLSTQDPDAEMVVEANEASNPISGTVEYNDEEE